MTAPRPCLSEADLKHLEFLQNVITRLGNNSFLVKGWSITLNGAFIAVASRGPDWSSVTIAIALAVGFWLLDSYYLRQERLFRAVYERVVSGGDDPPPAFTMDAERYGGHVTWYSVALSKPMLFCYGVLAVADSLLIIFLS